MALNLPNHQYYEDPRPGSGFGNQASTVVIESTWPTASLTVNSEHRVFKAARACWVSNFVLRASDMDTHATPLLTFDVGTDSDDDEFIAASTVGQGGGSEGTNTSSSGTATEPRGFPLAADEYIVISIKAAPATAAAGTTTLYFDVLDIG